MNRRIVYAAPVVAVGALGLAMLITAIAGVPLRDPDGVASGRLLAALGWVASLVVLDIIVRARRENGGGRPSLARIRATAAARWNRNRIVPLCMAVFAFFATDFAYRNMKSVVPLVRENTSFDAQLLELEAGMFGGRQPAELLHDLLGTGLAAHVLSFSYMLLFIFIPVTLAAALVFSTQLEAGLFYATALALNWVIGAGSYFVLPSSGPFDADPGLFAALPYTEVTRLQEWLLDERATFLADPSTPGAAQSIGAFASLHVSIFVTAALVTHLLGLRRSVKVLAWTLTGLTVVSTIYFGWHYLLDDVGGVIIAVLSLVIARAITGFDGFRVARPSRAPVVERA